jgi:hypothetical protein
VVTDAGYGAASGARCSRGGWWGAGMSRSVSPVGDGVAFYDDDLSDIGR